MLNKLLDLIPERFAQVVRYLLVGGIAYVFEMVVLSSLKFIGLSNVFAVAISFWAGLVFAFLMQRAVTFRDKRKQAGLIAKQAVLYLALVLFNYLFTLSAVHIFADTNVYLVRTIAIGITTCWNFVFYKYLFRSSSELPPE